MFFKKHGMIFHDLCFELEDLKSEYFTKNIFEAKMLGIVPLRNILLIYKCDAYLLVEQLCVKWYIKVRNIV